MIYLVEDDDSIRELVVYTLQSTGFEARGFADAAGFWEAVKKQKPEMALLDIMLPDEDGLTILKKLRMSPATRQLPVIMLTAKGAEYDKVIGLDSGADDYLPKPFGMMEMVSRVRAVLRRANPEKAGKAGESGKTVYRIGPVTADIPRHQVSVDGVPVILTFKEFELLCCLMEHEGLVLTRDQLLTRIWGYDFDGETRTVDVHIRTLRQKLGPGGNYIETVRGVGYKMEGTGHEAGRQGRSI